MERDVAALKIFAVLGLAGLTAAGQPRQQGSPDDLQVSAVRFYRADARSTQVKAFIQVPAMMLEPAGTGATTQLTYVMDVRVRDSSGLELVHDNWRGHLAGDARQPGAATLEILEYTVAPGRYTLQIGVADSVSGKRLTSELPIEGFRAEPGLSDLLLAPKIRQAGPQDTLPAPGEIRRGDLLITGAAELRLTPLRSDAYYMFEAYTEAADSARLAITVADQKGKAVVSTPPRSAQLPAGGGVLSGVIPLAGLPPGQYRLVAKLGTSKGTVERAADFVMADMEQTMARETSRLAATASTDEGYFGAMTSAQLDAAQAPLQLIAKSGELSPYKKDLSLQAKRRFLTQFWASRDPSPDTPENETRQAFYQAISFADSTYRERGRVSQPGWKTDRGRIYAKHGVADEMLRRQQHGNAPPYEVWQYSKGKGNWYIFADLTGVGGFKLMNSSDVKELKDPNWQTILGVDALEDIAQWLNLDRIELDRGGIQR
jgi:GWxTD domain-containing protein